MAAWAALRTFGKELRLADRYGTLIGDEVLSVFTPPGAPRLAREGRIPLATLGQQSALDASANFPSYEGSSDVVITAGYETYSDGGGLPWKRVSARPNTLTYFRKQDFDGHWYEAVTKNEIYGEQVGIFGDAGTDVGGIINDVIAWLHTKGGGRLILPPGVIHSDRNIVCDADGIWVSGTIAGFREAEAGGEVEIAGTIVELPLNKTILIGGHLGDDPSGPVAHERYMNKFSDFLCRQIQGGPITDPPTNQYFFTSRKIRGLQFYELWLQSIYGFHKAGNVDDLTITVYYDNVYGGLGPISQHFLQGINLGRFNMAGVKVQGPSDILPGTSFISIPSSAFRRPDGIQITNSSSGGFDRAIDITCGVDDMLVSNSRFDRCRTSAVRLASNQRIENVQFSNCRFAADPSDEAARATQIGIHLVGDEAPMRRVSINNCHIDYWGRNAIRLDDVAATAFSPEKVSITDNQFQDNCGAADNVEAVINVDPLANHVTISGNQIYKVATTGIWEARPKYGIDIGTAFLNTISVTNNNIYNVGTRTINNPNRGTMTDRRIHSNTGQLFEGQLLALGPWIEQNVAAGVSNFNMNLAAASIDNTFVHRRAQMVGIYARGSASVAIGAGPGTITFKATYLLAGTPTVIPELVCSATNQQFCFAEFTNGFELGANQAIGVQLLTTATLGRTDTDWAVYLAIIYD